MQMSSRGRKLYRCHNHFSLRFLAVHRTIFHIILFKEEGEVLSLDFDAQTAEGGSLGPLERILEEEVVDSLFCNSAVV